MSQPQKSKKIARSSHYAAPAMGMALEPRMSQQFTLSCCLEESRALRGMEAFLIDLRAEAIAAGSGQDFLRSWDCSINEARVKWHHYQEKQRLRDLTRQQRDLEADECAGSAVEELQARVEQCQESLRCREEELRVARLEHEAALARCKLLNDEARQRAKADTASAENSAHVGETALAG